MAVIGCARFDTVVSIVFANDVRSWAKLYVLAVVCSAPRIRGDKSLEWL